MNEAIQSTRRMRDLLIHESPALRRLLRINGRYAARGLRWDDLIAAAREAAPSTVLIIAPFDQPALPVPNPRVPELIGASAGVIPILALVPFQSACTAGVRTLLDQGVTEIADVHLEATPDAIRPRLQAVHAQPLKRLAEPALSRFASVHTHTLVRAAAEVAVDGGTAMDLAEVFRSTERTVSGWCAREALPQPRRLLAWLRLILALSLLESPHRSVARAARGAGYSFDHSLRRAIRDMLGGDAPRRVSARSLRRSTRLLRNCGCSESSGDRRSGPHDRGKPLRGWARCSRWYCCRAPSPLGGRPTWGSPLLPLAPCSWIWCTGRGGFPRTTILANQGAPKLELGGFTTYLTIGAAFGF
jgi:AraC-like DNA-binding protein